MSVVKIPKPIGTLTVPACPKCGEDHEGAIVFERGEGPYIICRRTVHYVPVGPGPYTPLPDGYEIKEWVPQGSMIGTVADLTCIAGHYKLRIERLEKQLAAPATAAAPAAIAPLVAPEFSANPAKGQQGYYWWAWHPCYPFWSQSCWGAPTFNEAKSMRDNPLFSRDYSHWKLIHKNEKGVFTEIEDHPAPTEHVATWQEALDFKNARAESPAPGVLAGGWVPVAERLPEPTIWHAEMPNGAMKSITHTEYWPVIIYQEGEGRADVALYETHKARWVDLQTEKEIENVTHWQPLPAAPANAQPL